MRRGLVTCVSEFNRVVDRQLEQVAAGHLREYERDDIIRVHEVQVDRNAPQNAAPRSSSIDRGRLG